MLVVDSPEGPMGFHITWGLGWRVGPKVALATFMFKGTRPSRPIQAAVQPPLTSFGPQQASSDAQMTSNHTQLTPN